jgi:hypothetical protein
MKIKTRKNKKVGGMVKGFVKGMNTVRRAVNTKYAKKKKESENKSMNEENAKKAIFEIEQIVGPLNDLNHELPEYIDHTDWDLYYYSETSTQPVETQPVKSKELPILGKMYKLTAQEYLMLRIALNLKVPNNMIHLYSYRSGYYEGQVDDLDRSTYKLSLKKVKTETPEEIQTYPIYKLSNEHTCIFNL